MQVSDQTHVYSVKNRETNAEEYLLSVLPHDTGFDRGLAPESILGRLTVGPDSVDPEHFAPNPRFLEFLHAVLAVHAKDCPGVRAEADSQSDGFVYLVDSRTVTPRGEIPAEDVIGAIEVRGGKLGSYQANPNYLALGVNGPMQLDPWLYERLIEELERQPAAG